MRKYLFGLAIPALSACLFSVDGPSKPSPQAGVYRGDHGELTRKVGLESELVLDTDGTFRYFLINANTAEYTAKGRWTGGAKEMIWTGVARSFLYHGAFRYWDTVEIPDTSYLRNVTDSGFERLEVTYDTLFVSVARWIQYRRITPENPLPEGTYEFTETYPDGADTTVTVTGLTRLKIDRNGMYVQHIYRDGVLDMMDVDSSWSQAGTYLITGRNHHCGYEPGFASCSDAPFDYEYVARLSAVGDSAFRLWMGPDFTYQPIPYWADFRKVE